MVVAVGGRVGQMYVSPAGKTFDVLLILVIILSVIVVMAESVTSIRLRYGPLLRTAEWVITILFTVEYVLRLLCVGRPWAYATSFYGIVDLLAILPTYISVLIPGTQALAVVRALRLVRVFRVLKLAQYVHDAAVAGRREQTIHVSIEGLTGVRVLEGLSEFQREYGGKIIYGDPMDETECRRHALREALLGSLSSRSREGGAGPPTGKGPREEGPSASTIAVRLNCPQRLIDSLDAAKGAE